MRNRRCDMFGGLSLVYYWSWQKIYDYVYNYRFPSRAAIWWSVARSHRSSMIAWNCLIRFWQTKDYAVFLTEFIRSFCWKNSSKIIELYRFDKKPHIQSLYFITSAIDEFDLEQDNYYLNPVDWTPETGFGTSSRRVLPRRGTGLGTKPNVFSICMLLIKKYMFVRHWK